MPVPASINKIEEKTKALKRYTKSFEIAIYERKIAIYEIS